MTNQVPFTTSEQRTSLQGLREASNNIFFFSLVLFLDSADDMGLGKTLTIIALILAKKIKAKEEDEKKEGKKLESWISKSGN